MPTQIKYTCSTCLRELKKSTPIEIVKGRWETELICPKWNPNFKTDHAHITKVEDLFYLSHKQSLGGKNE